MAETVPYVQAYGNITKALERIRQAQTPPRFTQDFLETKLNLSGGSARPVIPFLKRTGFLASDGTPTDLYSGLEELRRNPGGRRRRRCVLATHLSSRSMSTFMTRRTLTSRRSSFRSPAPRTTHLR